jgi:hypothetical protein
MRELRFPVMLDFRQRSSHPVNNANYLHRLLRSVAQPMQAAAPAELGIVR